jgi:hypothetical protein
MDEKMRAWWREGCLFVMTGSTTSTVEIARGPLAELVLKAVALPPEKQAGAVIDLDGANTVDRLTWPQIAQLYSRPDFPMII